MISKKKGLVLAEQVKEPIPLPNCLNRAAPKEYVSEEHRQCVLWIYALNPVYHATGTTAEEFPEGTISHFYWMVPWDVLAGEDPLNSPPRGKRCQDQYSHVINFTFSET